MRKILLPLIIIVSSILILVKLFYLQIIDETLKIKSDNNAIKIEFTFPERGYVYDRNGKLLLANQPSYDIMVVPREIKNLDTLQLCELLKVDLDYFNTKVKRAIVYSPRLPSVFLSELTKLEFAAFQEKIRKFKGFYIQKRFLRDYQTKNGANIFGYISQVNDAIIANNSYYKSGDLIGKQGIEQEYEKELRGVKGVKYFQKNRFNKIIGSYKNEKYDTIAVQGKDLTLTIDGDLQKYGEELMINKRGGIVAIEPKTGEILALVSAPSYDPALLVGKNRSKNYTMLYYDSIAKPLYDRSLLAEYPPGSPFKILTGLIGLQEEVIDEETSFVCHHGFYYGKGAFMKCHCSGMSILHNGIYNSCNTYFANVFKKTIDKYSKPSFSVDKWNKHLQSFGLGNYLGTDLPIGKAGRIPNSGLYEKFYPNGGWRSNTIISNAIGQGEIDVTPIQLANMMAAVANEGYYYTPHIVKKIKNFSIDKKFTTKHQTSIDKSYFKPVIEGLYDVYNIGTAKSLKVKDLEICGKTGTAENFAKIDGKRTQLTDHSIFVAFAPKDNPKIAIAVLVENGYWGNRWAGAIATLMIEKYLKGEVSRKDLEIKMLTGSLQSEYDKITSGKPFTINH
ncbi:penicillin-binding protein 2 [uncultured Flavobacterium sp.]|uniref:penicillin-binding protein 2 n=1 Tax=uncultured Flavobacterium sp. TaxID=165435 RepID=UPI0030CA3858